MGDNNIFCDFVKTKNWKQLKCIPLRNCVNVNPDKLMQWTTTTIKKNELKLCTVTDVQQTFYSFPVQKPTKWK